MRTRFGRLLESLAFRSLLLTTIIILAAFFVIKPDIHGHFSDDASSQAHEKSQHGEQDKVFFGLSPEGWTAVGTFGLFGATVALFVATYALFETAARESDKAEEALEVAKISAEASKQSADVAKAALVAGHRAWLTAEANMGKRAPVLNGAGLDINLEIRIRNGCNIPAKEVNYKAWLHPSDASVPMEAFRRGCEEYRNSANPAHFIVFPGEYLKPGVLDQGLHATRNSLDEASRVGTNRTAVNLYAMICINYRFDTDPSKIHQTSIMRWIAGFEWEFLNVADMQMPEGKLFMMNFGDIHDQAD